MPSLFGGATRAAVEGFLDTGNAEKRRNAYVDFVAIVLTYILVLVILSFVGKLLWNGVIVDLFTCVRPAKSTWHILGLLVFVSLLLP